MNTTMKIAIINYGMGNIGSVRRACTELGATVLIADHPHMLQQAEQIILPGVGSFNEGSARLLSQGWFEAIREEVLERSKPILGICLGMQLLASTGEEGGLSAGLDLIPGRVHKINKLGCQLRMPHVGWNEIYLNHPNTLFSNISEGTDFYFVHSYAFDPNDEQYINASVNYGVGIVAAVSHKHIFGVQFHPEKSSKAGRKLLQNFLSIQAC